MKVCISSYPTIICFDQERGGGELVLEDVEQSMCAWVDDVDEVLLRRVLQWYLCH